MPDQNIIKIINYISHVDRYSAFKEELNIIRETKYVVKSWYDLFPSATTTWGERYVKLQRNPIPGDNKWQGFFNLNIRDQSATLIHETVHQKQYKQYGEVQFLIHYLKEQIINGYNNNQFENKARERENQFRRIT
jgi:hypothetical protein